MLDKTSAWQERGWDRSWLEQRARATYIGQLDQMGPSSSKQYVGSSRSGEMVFGPNYNGPKGTSEGLAVQVGAQLDSVVTPDLVKTLMDSGAQPLNCHKLTE